MPHNLTSLDLEHNAIGPEGAKWVAQLLVAMNSDIIPHEPSSDIFSADVIVREPSAGVSKQQSSSECMLSFVHLRGNELKDEGAAAIARALEHCATVTSVDLEAYVIY